MNLPIGAIEDTLHFVLVEHDKVQGRKRIHNLFALNLYLEALESSMRFIRAGADTREVLIGHFNGEVLAKCLKALRLAPATFREENGNGYVRREKYDIANHEYSCGCKHPTSESPRVYDHACADCFKASCNGKCF